MLWSPWGANRSRRRRLTAGLTGAAATVTALALLVAVSAGAQPGDALYGLKRGTEQTVLSLASDSARGRTLLGFASTRLHELDRLLEQGTTVPVVDTLRTMDEQTAEGTAALTVRSVRTGDGAGLVVLRDWVAEQSDGLAALAPEVPGGAAEAVAGSLALLDEVADRGAGLRAALDCPAGPATSGTDALGPLPAPCPAAPVAPGSTPAPGSPGQEEPGAGVPAQPTDGAGPGSEPSTDAAPPGRDVGEHDRAADDRAERAGAGPAAPLPAAPLPAAAVAAAAGRAQQHRAVDPTAPVDQRLPRSDRARELLTSGTEVGAAR